MAVKGDFLSLTRDRKEKSRPSRAMAKMMRGSGNMEPNRLGRRWVGEEHQVGTTVIGGGGKVGEDRWKEVSRVEIR